MWRPRPRRGEAEHAKLVADTLNYISLGRNLGAQSYSVYQAGDTEIGNMLAYASYLYTRDYGGDFFVPAVFQALTQSAGGRRNFSVHNGSVSCTRISLKDNHLLTTSTYGEMFRHEMTGRQLQTRRLVSAATVSGTVLRAVMARTMRSAIPVTWWLLTRAVCA